jgi:hypothetical protein
LICRALDKACDVLVTLNQFQCKCGRSAILVIYDPQWISKAVAETNNWYPNQQLRFMLGYDIINVDRLNASGATQVGQ